MLFPMALSKVHLGYSSWLKTPWNLKKNLCGPDSQVRLIRLEATVQDEKFVFLNISLCFKTKRAT